MTNDYQICSRCIMDTSDPWISFNEQGVCSHCERFDTLISREWKRGSVGAQILSDKADEIRSYGADKEYDCIIGVSGGVDSSYLLHVAKKEMNLRPLAVHVDAGWNSELAVRNIENLTKKLGIELFTHVVDWEEMSDLQVAYLRSGLANQDVPQDHVFFAKLYEFAVQNDIKHVLTGANYSTESILPRAWGYNAKDSKQLKYIHKKFGTGKLESYTVSGLLKSHVYYPYIKGMKVFAPLNCMEYNAESAKKLLQDEYDWVYYGGKHHESRWTKFFQSYYLPKKFGYDKRRAHLSSLVVAGHMSREDALKEMEVPPYDEKAIENDLEYVAKKLELTVEDIHAFVNSENKDYTDYPNNSRLEEFMRFGKNILRRFS